MEYVQKHTLASFGLYIHAVRILARVVVEIASRREEKLGKNFLLFSLEGEGLLSILKGGESKRDKRKEQQKESGPIDLALAWSLQSREKGGGGEELYQRHGREKKKMRETRSSVKRKKAIESAHSHTYLSVKKRRRLREYSRN